jgi:hypothetical protein
MKIAEPVQNEREVSLAMTTVLTAQGHYVWRQYKKGCHCEFSTATRPMYGRNTSPVIAKEPKRLRQSRLLGLIPGVCFLGGGTTRQSSLFPLRRRLLTAK